MTETKADTNIDYYLSREYLYGDRPPPLKRGDEIGSLTLLNRTYVNRKDMWECKCICGKVKVIRGDSLRAGRTKTCGDHPKTVGRLNQKSSYRVRHGTTQFRIYGYHGNPTRPGSDHKLNTVGFCTIEKADAKPGEYFLSECKGRGVPKGSVPLLMKVGMRMLWRNGAIGPKGDLTYPQWADKHGVEYAEKLRSGHTHIRAVYIEKKEQQAFSHKDVWI